MVEPLSEIEGKYEVLERLQVGGMGAIYKVRHRLLGDERVIKVMRPQLVDDPELRRRFHREARAATRLTHPNVARLYDFSVDDEGAAYIVMEFIAGWTLDELIAHGELPPLGLTLEIARQGLAAIGHLHVHGVIHRDISPDNLMLTADVDGRPAVKLIDLGLIKSLATSGDLTATGAFVGKFRYASPEQFGHGGAPGPASDLYSFGLVVYELLTGRYPIVGKSASSLIAGHLFREPLPFHETDAEGRVPEDLRRAVMRALAKDPAERYPTAAAFAAALDPVRRRQGLDGATGKLLERIREPPPKQRLRTPSRGSTQSRFDRHFGTEPTPEPSDITEVTAAQGTAEETADTFERSWVRRVEAEIAVNDFAAAREELRQAIAEQGETEELQELRERIAVIEEITGVPTRAPEPPPIATPPSPPTHAPPAATPAREVEAELVEVEALRAAGRLEKALALARTLRERAPRHKLVKQVVIELERATAAPKVHEPAAAAAGPTQMLETVRSEVAEEMARPAGTAGSARRRADEMVAAAREHARDEDFTRARQLLRRALELVPDHSAGLALRISVETCVEVQEEEQRNERELESTLHDIRHLVAAGKAETAMHGLEEAARRFGERQELLELQEEARHVEGAEPTDDTASDLGDPSPATPAAEAFVTRPIATTAGPPPTPEPPATPERPATPEPPAIPEPPAQAAASVARGFDEISLQIPRQPRAAERPFDLDDLPLSSTGHGDASSPARGELPGSARSRRRTLLVAAVILVALLIVLFLAWRLSRDGADASLERAEWTARTRLHNFFDGTP